MITLAPTDNIAAKQDAGTDVLFSVSAVDSTDATQLQVATTNQGALSTTAAALITSPASGHSLGIPNLKFTNPSANTRIITLYKDSAGTTYDATTQWGTPIILAASESAEWTPSGWLVYDATGTPRIALPIGLQEFVRRVTADVNNSGTGFADITGLVVPLSANRKYAIEAYLFYITAATTTGARFGCNGPTSPALLALGQDSASTPGIAGTNIASGVISAYDTAMAASTTGPGAVRAIAQIQGTIEVGSNAGNFAMRYASEVAASAVTVQRGSYLKVKEFDS